MPSPIQQLARITQTPGQCGGKPCIRGMRIRVSDILEMMAENVSAEEILTDFPDLEPEDIRACLLFAASDTDLKTPKLRLDNGGNSKQRSFDRATDYRHRG